MAKKIIVLERIGEPSDESYNYVLWASVPAGREPAYANAAKTSAYKDATAAELTALETGTVVERTGTIQYQSGGGANIKQDLQRLFNDFQQEITKANPHDRYGTSYDGSTWTNAGTP
jgi:hypothetical protein